MASRTELREGVINIIVKARSAQNHRVFYESGCKPSESRASIVRVSDKLE